TLTERSRARAAGPRPPRPQDAERPSRFGGYDIARAAPARAGQRFLGLRFEALLGRPWMGRLGIGSYVLRGRRAGRPRAAGPPAQTAPDHAGRPRSAAARARTRMAAMPGR